MSARAPAAMMDTCSRGGMKASSGLLPHLSSCACRPACRNPCPCVRCPNAPLRSLPPPWRSNMECWDFMRCLPSDMTLFDYFAKLDHLEEL